MNINMERIIMAFKTIIDEIKVGKFEERDLEFIIKISTTIIEATQKALNNGPIKKI